ncbi:putative U-box domain protein [Aspergillus chevalieri]|uniref:U-box domain-containing protein n=1 Tax=Aspergillus chevalieri TaxID=182096 RepID=A0A7R7VP10_ASPCH|nr:uncharacterized protein ACHE_40621S [Aspergillus chevalieri]BCR88057.1 hypothetical protein ACHE_40621S [Aspergillus chevalieri]
MAFELKEKGNQLFKEGDYNGAEDYFSQAIQKNSREPTFFTNRALTRLRLEKWPGVEQDARAAIALYGQESPNRLKSSGYLVQALLGQQQPQPAYNVAIEAYRDSLSSKSPQTENLSKLVLRAKQQIWALKETRRLREMNDTLATVEGLIEAELQRSLDDLRGQLNAGEIGEIGFVEDEKALRADAERNIQNTREAFRAASKGEIAERVVPDYLVDGISFEIMHDPVITPSGTSFDRVGIVKYVEQSGTDPLTRVNMSVKDLRPNYALKAACEEFLDKNGWAVDW